MTQKKVKELISVFESRIKELENELNSKNNTGDMKIYKIGELQGIKLCVLAIKNLLTN